MIEDPGNPDQCINMYPGIPSINQGAPYVLLMVAKSLMECTTEKRNTYEKKS